MLKVVVFDSGWGGELFANYLEDELPIIEVIREIDWRNASGYEETEAEARKLARAAVSKYIGRVDLIVLAGQRLSIVALDYLKKCFPEQKFIGFKLRRFEEIPKATSRKIIYLTTNLVRSSQHYIEAKNDRRDIEFIEPECRGWKQMIDDGELTDEIINRELGGLIASGADTIMIGCNHFVDTEASLEKIFGWRVQIIDDFELVLKDVCTALRLRGGDGTRKK